MKLKLDENLGERGAAAFRAAGHDVATVYEQKLTSATDVKLIEVCGKEQRCLVTLDLDFSSPFRFPPHLYAGIAVLRLPDRASVSDLDIVISTLIAGLRADEISGRLWIVRGNRIRVYKPDDMIDENI